MAHNPEVEGSNPSPAIRKAPKSGAFSLVCRACTTAWRWKSSAQPGGGEVLAKRKGVTARWGLKEAWSKTATWRTETG